MVGLEYITRYIEQNEKTYGVLSREEQTKLFEKYNKVKGKNTDEEIKLRNEIACHNIRMIYDLMPKNIPIGLDKQDMFDAGFIGLLHAVELFDYTKEVGFYTYAAYWIKQRMQYLRIQMGRFVKIPHHLIIYVIKVEDYCNAMLAKTGKIPSLAEVKANCKVYRKENVDFYMEEAYNNYLYGQKRIFFRESPEYGDDAMTVTEKLERIPDTNKAVEESVIADDMSKRVHFIIDEVITDDREKYIIKNLYGLNEENKCISGTEIGKKLGISRQRVNQIFIHAARKLRHCKYTSELKNLLYVG